MVEQLMLWDKAERRSATPNEMDGPTGWFAQTVELALTLAASGPFYFDQLRERCAVDPVAPCCWGHALTAKMKAAGLRQTGRYRKSVTESRKAGYSFEWYLDSKD